MDFACEVFATYEDFVASDCQCGELEQDAVEALLEDASDLLAFMAGGRTPQRCTSTLRPCRESACGWFLSPWPHTACCCGVDYLPLVAPIVSINLITIDGEALPSGNYKVIDGDKLVRTDGAIWPGCQNVTADSTEEGTFAVNYTFGRRPPVFAKLATVELACALFNGISIPGRQRLPGATTYANHQGVQVGFATRAGAVQDFALELPFVQQYLALYGPDSGPGRGYAYAPEMYDGWVFHTE